MKSFFEPLAPRTLPSFSLNRENNPERSGFERHGKASFDRFFDSRLLEPEIFQPRPLFFRPEKSATGRSEPQLVAPLPAAKVAAPILNLPSPCQEHSFSSRSGDSHMTMSPVSGERGFRAQNQNAVKGKAKGGDFAPVVQVLASWLMDTKTPPNLDDLSDFHLELIATIIKRKFALKEDLPDNATPREKVLSFFGKSLPKSFKRTEENNKFVFKHTIKLMKQSLRKKTGDELAPMELESRFNALYFAGANGSLARGTGKAGSLSLATLRKAFLDQRFAEDFQRFLTGPSGDEDSPLVNSYIASIPKKLSKLFRKWERVFEEDSEKAQAQVLNYFRLNAQCKLPWTVEEILTATRSISVLVPPQN